MGRQSLLVGLGFRGLEFWVQALGVTELNTAGGWWHCICVVAKFTRRSMPLQPLTLCPKRHLKVDPTLGQRLQKVLGSLLKSLLIKEEPWGTMGGVDATATAKNKTRPRRIPGAVAPPLGKNYLRNRCTWGGSQN